MLKPFEISDADEETCFKLSKVPINQRSDTISMLSRTRIQLLNFEIIDADKNTRMRTHASSFHSIGLNKIRSHFNVAHEDTCLLFQNSKSYINQTPFTLMRMRMRFKKIEIKHRQDLMRMRTHIISFKIRNQPQIKHQFYDAHEHTHCVDSKFESKHP